VRDYKERECDKCNILPMLGCRKCHAGLLARYRGGQVALAEALAESQAAQEEIAVYERLIEKLEARGIIL
jgi:hypothetical protein